MCGHAAEDERRQEGERHDEGVEETVVAFSHAVPHPRTVMVEAFWRRNAQRVTMSGTAWTESSVNWTGARRGLGSLFITGKCQEWRRVAATHPHSCHTGCSGRCAEAGTSCRWSSTWASPPAGWWGPPWCAAEADSWCFQCCLQRRGQYKGQKESIKIN